MGDMADFALDQMMDWDELTINGYYDDTDNLEDGDSPMWPFSRQRPIRASTPGPCPRCGSPTVERTNSHSGVKFFGCSTFPACKGSR